MRNVLLSLALAALTLASCQTTGGSFAGPVLDAAVGNADGAQVGFLRIKPLEQVGVLGVQSTGHFRIMDSYSGATLWSGSAQAGQTIAFTDKLKITVNEGEPLPSWAAQVFFPYELTIVGGVVTMAEYGLTFTPAQP